MIVLGTAPLLKMIYSSVIAGVSVALVFSIAVPRIVSSSNWRQRSVTTRWRSMRRPCGDAISAVYERVFTTFTS